MLTGVVIRACVAMCRPGLWSGGLDPERDPVPLQDEAIPQDGPVETATSLIHFDIDPDNSKQPKKSLYV